MKKLLCLLGIHDYKRDFVYLGGRDWQHQLKCARCGRVKSPSQVSWYSTRKRWRVAETKKRGE